MVDGRSDGFSTSSIIFEKIEILSTEVNSLFFEIREFTVENWEDMLGSFETWGEVPRKINSLIGEDDHMLIQTEQGDYKVQISNYPAAGMRARKRSEDERVDWPCGGISYRESDIMLIWPHGGPGLTAEDVLRRHLHSGDIDSAVQLLERCGTALGSAHESLSAVWSGPPNSKSWNSVLTRLEEATDSRTLWRAPFRPGMPAVLTFGTLSFSCFTESPSGTMRIRPTTPQLTDAVGKSLGIEWPALRDLASLLNELGELCMTDLSSDHKTLLRKALIDGWQSVEGSLRTGGRKPRKALQILGGGLAIWEYEQALSRTMSSRKTENTVHYSSRRLLETVSSVQRRLFTIRILSLLSITGLATGMIGSLAIIFDSGQFALPASLAGYSVFAIMRVLYAKAAPPPEAVFN